MLSASTTSSTTIERRADTPSSVPTLSEWTRDSSPGRALGDRINEYFSSAHHDLDCGSLNFEREFQHTVELQRVFHHLAASSTITIDRILRLAYTAAKHNNSLLDMTRLHQ